jgi:catechol 2,3-dioxygenase-like lactoylglutathione lyase family enzyme
MCEVEMNQYWNVMVPEITVLNFEKSLAFYTETLGFSVRYQRKKPNFVYIEQENVQIMIEQYTEDGRNVAELSKHLGRVINFQMALTDIEPMLKRINSAQIKLYRELKESWYDTGGVLSGQKEILVQDPDGYLLRFTQYLGEKPKP